MIIEVFSVLDAVMKLSFNLVFLITISNQVNLNLRVSVARTF